MQLSCAIRCAATVRLPDPASACLNDGVPPEIIAQEIVDDPTAALAEFSAVADAPAARAAARTLIPPEH
jgi:type I restriction enzyme M protein